MVRTVDNRIFSAFSPQFKRWLTVVKKYGKNELKSSRSPMKNFLLLYFTLLLLIFSYTAYNLYGTYKKVEQTRRNEIDRMLYWEEVSAQYPQFPDAYYKAAYHALRLGYPERASKHLTKAVFIDPTFEDAKILQKQIQEKKY